MTAVNRAPDIKAQGYEQGADGYITRPISNVELVSIINVYLKLLIKIRQLKRSEMRWNLLSDLSFEGLLIHDTKNIIDINKTLLNMMGYDSIEELPEFSSLIEFVAPDSKALVLEKFEQKFTGTYRANLKKRNGIIFPVEINCKNITIDGKPARAISIQDITERCLLESEVNNALKKALEASKMKSQFVANVSHEIRTPITSIATIIELIKDTPLSKEQLDYIEMIRQSANNLLIIINDLLDISKIESGKIEIEDIEFDMFELIDSIFELFNYQAKAKGIEMRLQRDENIPKYLQGDPAKVKQILASLLNNAIKFTEKGFVSLSIQQHTKEKTEDPVILFNITDSGRGISTTKQEIIFDSFVQEEATTSRIFGGTGLGLTISKNLINLMGGQIWVESELGIGSSFYFTIPFKSAKKHDIKHEESVDLQAPCNEFDKIRILLVEDNQLNKLLVEKILEKNGFIVKSVSNGMEALDTMNSNDDFDIILMDLQMPEMDGFETTSIIRGHKIDPRWNITKRDVPIIALTANAMKEDRQLCISAGMDEYVSKPIDLNSLLSIIKKFTSNRKSSPACSI